MNSPHTITMTFDMTDPEGRSAFGNARQGLDRGLVLWDLEQEMRACVKHDAKPWKPRGLTETEWWRERLWTLMDDRGVTEVRDG